MMRDPVSEKLKNALIKKQTCFSKLADREIEMLASLLEEKRFKPGDVIVNEGDPVDSFYLIVSGNADVRHVTYKNDSPQIESVATLSAKNWDAIGLNETGFYSLSGLRTATVVALTDMVLLTLRLPVFHGFALNYPHVSEVMREQSRQFASKS